MGPRGLGGRLRPDRLSQQPAGRPHSCPGTTAAPLGIGGGLSASNLAELRWHHTGNRSVPGIVASVVDVLTVLAGRVLVRGLRLQVSQARNRGRFDADADVDLVY